MSERNWAGNVTFRATEVREPRSVDELRAIVADATAAGHDVRALGSRHSFSTIADTDGILISTAALDRVVEIDHDAMTVTAEAGITYGALGAVLHDAGLALANLPSLPHITVGGAVATGTHGSGVRHRCLSAAVRSIEYVTSTGDLTSFTRGIDDGFDGAVVAVGRLGVAARLVLDVEPTFDVRQVVYRGLPIDVAADHLDEVLGAAYSVSLFTDWQSDVFHQVWVKERADAGAPPAALFGAAPATDPLHMVESVSAASCTEQLGVIGPWHERLPHFRPDRPPSVGDELQTEYFVAEQDGPDAIRSVHSAAEHLAPLILACEVRAVAADDLWLSGMYGRDSVALHFTWRNDQAAVMDMLPRLEAALAPFDPRPHWGKLTAMSRSDVAARFERYDDFERLVSERRR